MIGAATVAQQDFVQGLEIGQLLALDINPLWGYAFVAAGLALCLVGYHLYRFMVALAAAAAGGATTYLFAPGFGIDGPSLWTTTIGVAVVLVIVGYFLYEIAVFLTGAASGLALGIVLWLVGSGHFTDISQFSTLTIPQEDVPAAIATGVPIAIGLGVVAYQWERRMITLIAVMLGATFIALGIRVIGPPELVARWAPVIASAALLGGLYLSSRSQQREPRRGRSRSSGRAPSGGRGRQRQRSRGARPQAAGTSRPSQSSASR